MNEYHDYSPRQLLELVRSNRGAAALHAGSEIERRLEKIASDYQVTIREVRRALLTLYQADSLDLLRVHGEMQDLWDAKDKTRVFLDVRSHHG